MFGRYPPLHCKERRNRPCLRACEGGAGGKVVSCYMGDWEEVAIGVQHRAERFRLQEKCLGVVIHDKEDGDEPYDEVRKICAIVWDRGTRMFKANTQLLR